MKRKEIMRFLLQQQGNNMILDLEGIISGIIEIESLKITRKKRYLFLNNIGLNLNQLMRISMVNKNEILLEFDQLQNVKIKITKAKSTLL